MTREEDMLKAIQDMAHGHEAEVKRGMGHAIKNMVLNSMYPKDALGVGDKKTEELYAEAYRLYNNGRYEKAQKLFSTLILLNAIDPRFIFGLAACMHMKKEYAHAGSTYVKCAIIDFENPIPYYHAADCWIQLNDPLSAITNLNLAIKRCGDKPEFDAIKKRCILTLESLTRDGYPKVKEGKAA